MRARYSIKPKRRADPKQDGAAEQALMSVMGPAQPLPDKLRALIEWADNPESWKKK